MKTLLIGLLVVSSSFLNAKEARRINIDCPGEVRFGSNSGEGVLVAFETVLEIELAEKLIEVSRNNFSEGSLKCEYDFNAETFYRFSHKANMNIQVDIKSNGKSVTKSFECDALVHDGGNQTLKKSCAKKIASEVRKILDESI